METNGLWRERVGGGRSPYLHGDVGRCRDEGAAVLCEHEVVNPVGVCLDLLAELRGRRLVGGGIRVGEGVTFFAVVRKVEVQVPGAYDAVATARIAGVCTSDRQLPAVAS